MSKSTLIGNDAGVVVLKRDGDFTVAFEKFSDTLAKKMGFLAREDAGVKYNDALKCWDVPATLKDKLAAVVDNMRDFVRSDGVQVTEHANGDRYVEFDYAKQLYALCAGIADAKFDNNIQAFRIPATSVALQIKEGFDIAYFDKVVHEMRSTRKEIDGKLNEVLSFAKDHAATNNLKPVLVFGHVDSSRSGPILKANTNFAVQEGDKKDGISYMYVHNQDSLNKLVFEKDDLYISYDKKGHGNVRTQLVFKAQNAERESMREFANSKLSDAKVLNASLDNSQYDGDIVKVGKYFALQSTKSPKGHAFTLHNLDRLDQEPAQGVNLSISYKSGKGHVADKSVKKAAGVER
jgi:hypothetical protein